ncbi:hypothetical protein NDU88_001664 [Pleurodeles waltl]|uniref:Uncharacterized protein n=1 Tax=Pleurodeles waltl TaxID=8319 RepID=A0AAV7NGD9_PLEWA|nr:hypothetical protein NDU88_001664 [Pleurodeles waltl]
MTPARPLPLTFKPLQAAGPQSLLLRIPHEFNEGFGYAPPFTVVSPHRSEPRPSTYWGCSSCRAGTRPHSVYLLQHDPVCTVLATPPPGQRNIFGAGGMYNGKD